VKHKHGPFVRRRSIDAKRRGTRRKSKGERERETRGETYITADAGTAIRPLYLISLLGESAGMAETKAEEEEE